MYVYVCCWLSLPLPFLFSIHSHRSVNQSIDQQVIYLSWVCYLFSISVYVCIFLCLFLSCRLLGTSSVVLSFNGGKDAIATLHLYRAALAKFYIEEYRKRREEEKKKKRRRSKQHPSSSPKEGEIDSERDELHTTSSSSSSSSASPPPLSFSSSSLCCSSCSSSSCNADRDEESGKGSCDFCEFCFFCQYEKAKDNKELDEGSRLLPLYHLITASQDVSLACEGKREIASRKVNSNSISLSKEEEKGRRDEEEQEEDRGILSSGIQSLQAQASAFYSDLENVSSSSLHQYGCRPALEASFAEESRHLWGDAKKEERKGEGGEREREEEKEADDMKEEAFRCFRSHVEKHLKVVLPMERPKALFFHGGEKEFTEVAELTEEFARRYEFDLQ